MPDYNEDILIDEYNLDKEWEAQSGLYMKWAVEHADSLFSKDKIKSELDLLYAQLDGEVRANPGGYGLPDRTTEAMIKSTVMQLVDYVDKHTEYLEAVKNANIMQSAKETMHHRRKALENLTQLFIGGYYSKPNIPQKAKDMSSEKTDQIISENLKKSKRKLKRKE